MQSYEGWAESKKSRIKAIEEELYSKAAFVEEMGKMYLQGPAIF